MKVFVTGASGWIGSALVPELIGAGHRVVGLARSDQSARLVEKMGAIPRRGDLTDTAGLAEAAAASDGVVHLAFQHDIAFGGDFASAARNDRTAVEAMGAALAGTGRPFVLASGVFGLTPGHSVTERDGLAPSPSELESPLSGRHATALLTLSLFGVGVRPMVVRFAPTVHGEGDHGFMAALVRIARQSGVSAFVGEGTNRWPAVYRFDAARLVRIGLEKAPAASVLHAVGEEGVPFREIARTIGTKLGVPTRSISPEAALKQFSFLGNLVGLDSPASAAKTRDFLGWKPEGPGLIEDLEKGHYFQA